MPELLEPYTGWRRLARSLRVLTARARGGENFLTVDTRVPGLRFRVTPRDDVGRHIARDGVHEPANTAWLLQNLRLQRDDVALDIGANIGWYSLLLGQIGSGKVDIFAFEPEPENFANLRGNIALNGASRVQPQQLALGEAGGALDLYLYKGSNRGRHSALPLHDGQRIRVPVARLDHWWQKQGLGQRPLRFIKIDIEGYELPALRGSGELLQRCQLLMLEFSPELMRRAGLAPAELLQLLTGAGFAIHRLQGGALQRQSTQALQESVAQVDLICTRPGVT